MGDQIQGAFPGNESTALTEEIGKAASRLESIAGEMAKAKDEDTARYQTLREEMAEQSKVLTGLKADHDAKVREAEVKSALESVAEWQKILADVREPSKALAIAKGAGLPQTEKGAFLYGVFAANHRDAALQAEGKAILAGFGAGHQSAWGKSTLGTTDATGGWVIPNAVVAEFITPAAAGNIYLDIMTPVPGVTAAAVDIPFRSAVTARATVIAFGQTKENLDLAYNGYTATMYTLARIYDIGNQFLRQSRGAAEADVLATLAQGFALGQAYYIREGSGSSEPFGYTSALTNGPAAFRSTFSPAATTLAGSMAAAIATAGGALAARGVTPTAAVLSASSFWSMLAQGTDTAGFFFAPAGGPQAINGVRPGTLVTPFGIPVYPDAAADMQNTAAVVDNLVVADWKAFKVFLGQDYRVDSSDVAGTRWDTNLTGFRGEMEMGFDARPSVYAGRAQMITDIVP